LRTRRSDSFTTITVAGQVLPADLLQRIADKDKELGGLGADSYHLSPSESISEATSRAWNKLIAAWANFITARSKLPPNEPGTTVTRERWLLPLFQELGYGRLPASRSAVEIDGKGYAISHWWSSVPIHLVGAGVSLDKLSARIAGAARSSPHSLVQELLNRSEESLWGFVSNGSQLRILRDNQNLVRQAYVEFDLESMMEGEAYSDFVMLWLLCHQSRVEAEKTTEFWLEKWSRAAQEQGVRALERLREGVEGAISLLGGGFLAHRANTNLKENLRSGLLNKQDYYRQLLRLVYRLLFLFVAEDRTDEKSRSLLFDPVATQDDCERYTNYYSTKKLRTLAERRHGSRHSDLYVGLRLVMSKLGSDTGCSELGLPALGSFLFSEDAIGDLSYCEIANHDLLDAVRALAFTTDNQTRRQIDYKNLGSEELGSVYESLLELHPEINADAAEFALSTAAGHERKTTGSYYTPDSLVQCLLNSALDPVLDERQYNYTRLGYESAENAIRNLKVCDPACGSGHFLIAAAHRIAYRLAAVQTGDVEPSPDAVRHALRDVVGQCIYGVDLNPMSVELCKVSLWMEAVEPGKPLSFLDHHIQCGNSLIGANPALIKAGLPDGAFKPIEGDDPELCSEYRKQNKRERQQESLRGLSGEPWELLGNFPASMISIEKIADDTIHGVRQRQERYENLVRSNDYLYSGLLADAWCASFVFQKQKSQGLPYPITEEEFRKIEKNPFNTPPWMKKEVGRLAKEYQFFHWHLAFPNVFRMPAGNEQGVNGICGWAGGFDIIIGNPPWDKIQPEEEKFFATVRPDISNAKSAKTRKELIASLPIDDSTTHAIWIDHKRHIEGLSQLVKQSGLFRFSSEGNLNTYRVFTELASLLLGFSGRAGLVVQTGIATDESGKELFDHLLATNRLVQFLDFENRHQFFQSVHPQFRFCLLTIGSPNKEGSALFGWLLHGLEELDIPGRLVRLSASDLLLFNPTSKTCPVFVSERDLAVSRIIYQNSRHVFINENQRFCQVKFLGEVFNLTRDSKYFFAQGSVKDQNVLPLYEAKYIHQFDHRFATANNGSVGDSTNQQKLLSDFSPTTTKVVSASEVRTRFHKRGITTEWLLGFRDISSGTNERTAIMAAFPMSAVGNSINLVLGLQPSEAISLLANVNTFAFDYCCRQKVSGTHVNIWIFKQLAVIPAERYLQPTPWLSDPLTINIHSSTLFDWILPRVLELSYTAWDLESFATDSGYDGPPFRWNDERRFLLRCELDAAFFHLYLENEAVWAKQLDSAVKSVITPREIVDYIMETFPIVKRKDIENFGEYRTKLAILEIYDEMAKAMATGHPYQTRLNPPAADARVAHPSRVQPWPLVLPSTVRYPQPDVGVYMMRVILSMLQESSGSIDVERLMNACELLAMPDRLETYGSKIEPNLAHQWRTSFNDQFTPDLFLPKIDDLVQRGEIRLTREGTRFKVARIGTAVLPADAHIDFDARFALRVNDSIPQAEKDAFTPLATHDQIEERTRAA
jgi:hypothetical protein